MDNRLKRFKSAMEKTYMKDLDFSDSMKKRIHESIAKESVSEQDIFINILQLLMKERTGFELTRLLVARGITKYENEEGSIYAVLHEQEQAGIITSFWGTSGEKMYQLTNKGRRMLEKVGKRVWQGGYTLKEEIGR